MKLDGAAAAAAHRETLAGKVEKLEQPPGLGIILATDDGATQTYVERKRQAAETLGFTVEIANLGSTAEAATLQAACAEFNQNDTLSGYIVQFPLPEGVDRLEILETVDPAKDADGLTPTNLGRLAAGRPRILPATPKGVMSLLAYAEVDPAGQRATVVGQGMLTGAPLSLLLAEAGATVTSCNSRTVDLASHTITAEILVSAVGKPGLITAEMVADGAVVIDIGTTPTPDGLKGDVDYDAVESKATVSPVPGGVGPMTVVSLLENVVELAEQARQANR